MKKLIDKDGKCVLTLKPRAVSSVTSSVVIAITLKELEATIRHYKHMAKQPYTKKLSCVGLYHLSPDVTFALVKKGSK